MYILVGVSAEIVIIMIFIINIEGDFLFMKIKTPIRTTGVIGLKRIKG
jgi:hypothetical protein